MYRQHSVLEIVISLEGSSIEAKRLHVTE